MIEIDRQLTIEFGQKVDYNVEDYFIRYYRFFRDNFPFIVAFFRGRLNSIQVENFTELEELIKESQALNNKLKLNSYLLRTLKDWELVEYIGDLDIELLYMKRVDKFLRSSIVNSVYTTKYEFNTTLKRETLENLSKRVLNSEDYNNDWADIAKRNDLQELDYTYEGGNDVVVSFDLTAFSGVVLSVIDNMVGEKILGLDIQKYVRFENDDLVILDYQQTFEQAVEILSDLRKGDIPEFKDLGRSKFIGDNVKIFAYGSLSQIIP